jgi:hypothetical protein
LKEKYQALLWADDVSKLGENVNTVTKNTKSLVESGTKFGLEESKRKPNTYLCFETKIKKICIAS